MSNLDLKPDCWVNKLTSKQKDGRQDRLNAIVETIKANPQITAGEITKLINTTQSVISKDLELLVCRGLITKSVGKPAKYEAKK